MVFPQQVIQQNWDFSPQQVIQQNWDFLLSQTVVPQHVIQQNWDFSSDPHHNSPNFLRGKISGF